MATSVCTSGARFRKIELLREIEVRLELNEKHIEQLRLRYRTLLEDDPERPQLLRQLERSTAVASELEDLAAFGLS